MQTRKSWAIASLAMMAAGAAYAADQTILGSSLVVKNPGAVDKRKIVGQGKEKNSPNTLVGNPVVTGGTVTITANGGTPTAQTFLLPQGVSPITGKQFWSGDSVKGFKYKDPKGENGPVKGVQIKRSNSGKFLVKVTAIGKLGFIFVTPPNPGTSGCVLLGINGGDTYSVQFGPTSQITNQGTSLFRAKKPTVEGTCITTTTTTTTSTTTTTIPYGSPSRAFLDRVSGILD